MSNGPQGNDPPLPPTRPRSKTVRGGASPPPPAPKSRSSVGAVLESRWQSGRPTDPTGRSRSNVVIGSRRQTSPPQSPSTPAPQPQDPQRPITPPPPLQLDPQVASELTQRADSLKVEISKLTNLPAIGGMNQLAEAVKSSIAANNSEKAEKQLQQLERWLGLVTDQAERSNANKVVGDDLRLKFGLIEAAVNTTRTKYPDRARAIEGHVASFERNVKMATAKDGDPAVAAANSDLEALNKLIIAPQIPAKEKVTASHKRLLDIVVPQMREVESLRDGILKAFAGEKDLEEVKRAIGEINVVVKKFDSRLINTLAEAIAEAEKNSPDESRIERFVGIALKTIEEYLTLVRNTDLLKKISTNEFGVPRDTVTKIETALSQSKKDLTI